MRLVICTQYYPPEIGAPQNRLSEIAKKFVERGHEVTVLTAMPNYPTGKIHKGYGGLLKREKVDGVDVIRTFIYPTQSASFVKRLTNYFSFVISSACFGTLLLEQPDFLIVESPPLFLAFSGIWLKLVKRTRLIFNVSDLWPESAVSLGLLRRESLAYSLSAWLEKQAYKKAWIVSGQSKEIISDIKTRFPSVQTYHLSNGVDVERFGLNKAHEEERKLFETDKHFVVLYSGLHGLAQGLEQIIEAATLLRDNQRIKFFFMGDGPEKANLVKTAKERGLTNVCFLDPRPSNEIPHFLAAADVLLVPLKMHIPGAVPSKLYEAMASEKPVLLIADSEAAKIVEDNRAGIVIRPGDINSIVDGLQHLCNNAEAARGMGANGRDAAEKYFDRNIIATRFINFLEESLK